MPDPKKMEEAVHAYVAAFDRQDPDAAAALYAEDCTVEDPVGSPQHKGRAAVRAFYATSMKTGAKLTIEGPIRIAQDYAAFAFSVMAGMDGKPVRIDVIDTMRFNDDNKIVEMRAYFGSSNFNPQ